MEIQNVSIILDNEIMKDADVEAEILDQSLLHIDIDKDEIKEKQEIQEKGIEVIEGRKNIELIDASSNQH